MGELRTKIGSTLAAVGLASMAITTAAGTAVAAPGSSAAGYQPYVVSGDMTTFDTTYFTGETFNRKAPCDTRGQWYYDNYTWVISWVCSWKSSSSSYQLWVTIIT